MTLTLEIRVGSEALDVTDGAVAVADSADLKLRVTDDNNSPPTGLDWSLDGKTWPGPPEAADTTDGPAAVRTVKAKDIMDKVVVASKGQDKTESITIGSAKATGAPTSGDSVSETELGEYDPHFGVVVCSLLVLLMVGLGVAVYGVGSAGLKLLDVRTVEPAANPTVDNRAFAERATFLIALMGATAGCVAVAVGAALAAIEARGRLRRVPASTRGPDDPVGSLGKLLEPLRRMRGTVATLGVGMVLLVAAMWTSANVADPAIPNPTPSQSSSPTPSAG